MAEENFKGPNPMFVKSKEELKPIEPLPIEAVVPKGRVAWFQKNAKGFSHNNPGALRSKGPYHKYPSLEAGYKAMFKTLFRKENGKYVYNNKNIDQILTKYVGKGYSPQYKQSVLNEIKKAGVPVTDKTPLNFDDPRVFLPVVSAIANYESGAIAGGKEYAWNLARTYLFDREEEKQKEEAQTEKEAEKSESTDSKKQPSTLKTLKAAEAAGAAKAPKPLKRGAPKSDRGR